MRFRTTIGRGGEHSHYYYYSFNDCLLIGAIRSDIYDSVISLGAMAWDNETQWDRVRRYLVVFRPGVSDRPVSSLLGVVAYAFRCPTKGVYPLSDTQVLGFTGQDIVIMRARPP